MYKGIDHATLSKARVTRIALLVLAMATVGIGPPTTAPTTRPTSQPTASQPITFKALVYRMPMAMRPPPNDHWTSAERNAAVKWLLAQLEEDDLFGEVSVKGRTRHNADDTAFLATFHETAFGIAFTLRCEGKLSDTSLRALRKLEGDGTAQATLLKPRVNVHVASGNEVVVIVQYEQVELRSVRPEAKNK